MARDKEFETGLLTHYIESGFDDLVEVAGELKARKVMLGVIVAHPTLVNGDIRREVQESGY